jgi:hypothetical protein
VTIQEGKLEWFLVEDEDASLSRCLCTVVDNALVLVSGMFGSKEREWGEKVCVLRVSVRASICIHTTPHVVMFQCALEEMLRERSWSVAVAACHYQYEHQHTASTDTAYVYQRVVRSMLILHDRLSNAPLTMLGSSSCYSYVLRVPACTEYK